MILVADIGNTNIVIALNRSGSWVSSERIKTSDPSAADKLRDLLKKYEYDRAVISSVVPDLTEKIKSVIQEFTKNKVLEISNNIKTGLDNSTVPSEMGSDLLCNLIAAHYYYPNDYVTVADFGTAFTTSTVSPEGKVLGVTIAPGMMTSVKALFSNTAQLPQIRLDMPNTVLGRNTVESIRAGVIYGFTGQLNAIVEEIEKELNTKIKVVVTGGFSKYVTGYVKKLDRADIYFTLEGAKLASELNG